jgi:hypothetical protein
MYQLKNNEEMLVLKRKQDKIIDMLYTFENHNTSIMARESPRLGLLIAASDL